MTSLKLVFSIVAGCFLIPVMLMELWNLRSFARKVKLHQLWIRLELVVMHIFRGGLVAGATLIAARFFPSDFKVTIITAFAGFIVMLVYLAWRYGRNVSAADWPYVLLLLCYGSLQMLGGFFLILALFA